MRNADYDAIVIGSGLSGLTTATSLAQAGQKVLLLERHYNPGGWSQQITVAGHRFCGGIHYTGELGPGQRMRKLFEDVGVANEITFMELNPRNYDHALCPEDHFVFSAGRAELGRRLTDRFPREKKGIDAYLRTCETLNRQWEDCEYLHRTFKDLPTLPFRAPTLARFGLSSFQSMISTFVDDPRLKWILSHQVLATGLPPDRLSGVLQAVLAAHFLEGGYYPSEGGHGMVRGFLKVFRKAGGELKVKTPVAEILIEGRGGQRQATGVRLEDGSVITAGNIVSSADLPVTFGKLVKPEHLSRFLRWRVGRTRYTSSCVLLFLVIKTDPRKLGLDSGSVYWSEEPDWNRSYYACLDPDILKKRRDFPALFLAADSLKDPLVKKKAEGYMISAFVPLDYRSFSEFSDSRFGDRPPAYDELKRHAVDMVLNTIEKIIPDFREHILHCEASTPLTNEHYISAAGGSMYGAEHSVFQTGPFAFEIDTEIRNLYLVGHNTVSHGVLGGGLSGRLATSMILGCKYDELPRARGQQLRIVPSDPENKDQARIKDGSPAGLVGK